MWTQVLTIFSLRSPAEASNTVLEISKSIQHKAFIITNNPQAEEGCLILHIPTGYWCDFKMEVAEAYKQLINFPESEIELRDYILEQNKLA